MIAGDATTSRARRTIEYATAGAFSAFSALNAISAISALGWACRRRQMRAVRPALALTALALLAGCASAPKTVPLDTSITAQGQNSRVRYIMLHYTAGDTARSLKVLSQGQVSSHYLITDDRAPKVYRLVDETRNAWHAGDGSWYGQSWLNTSSIGIEIVNMGPIGTQWQPYSDAQVSLLIRLIREIAARHDVKPQHIIGHSDASPQRKTDPGPAFPWEKLAQAGIGRWYDINTVARFSASLAQTGLPDVLWFQRELARVGYGVPQHGQLDRATINVLAAFQMHYRPTRYDGQPDIETAAILSALE